MKFMVVYSLMAAAYIVWWFWRKRRAGALLLNIGRSKGCIVLGVVSLLLETVMTVWTVFLPCGLILLFMGFVGRQVRENGFFGVDWFIRWEQIESWEWRGRTNHTLNITAPKRVVGRRTRWRTPPHHKNRVESLLAEHVSGATTETDTS